MKSKMKNIVRNSFEWMKFDYFLTSFLIIFIYFLSQKVVINEVIKIPIFMMLLCKSLSLINSNSILNTFFASSDNFSWKFFNALPLKRWEIVFGIILSYLISAIPFLIGFALFNPTINDIYKVESLPKNIINLILGGIGLCLLTIKSSIVLPRRQNNVLDGNKRFVEFLKVFLFVFAFLFFLKFVLFELSEYYGKNPADLYISFFKTGGNIITSWWSVPIMIVILIYYYLNLLRLWSNEKISYKKYSWNPKKEYALIAIFSLIIGAGIYTTDFETPFRYQGKLHTAIYAKDIKKIESLLNKGLDINKKNLFGRTPIMIAIAQGDVETAKFLKSKGANLNEVLIDKNAKISKKTSLMLAIYSNSPKMLEYVLDNGFDANEYYSEVGIYPIHYAARDCSFRMLDVLIKRGSKVDSVSKDGSTALMEAAERPCISGAIALKDAGANFEIINKAGKRAIDLAKKDSDIAYFIEKNSRKPATEINKKN